MSAGHRSARRRARAAATVALAALATNWAARPGPLAMLADGTAITVWLDRGRLMAAARTGT